MLLLLKVKQALRIKNNIFDLELEGLIDACKLDLQNAGINSEKINSEDALVNRAIILYVKMNFGFDNPDYEKLRRTYNALKTNLALVGDYKNVVV